MLLFCSLLFGLHIAMREIWTRVAHPPSSRVDISCFTDEHNVTWCALDADLMRLVDAEDSY